jgi:hypothetical protein
MHWFCIVLFLITHMAVFWLEPARVQAARPKAEVQVMASLLNQASARVERAQDDLQSPKYSEFEKSSVEAGFTVAQTNGPDLVVSALSTPNTKVSWGQKIDLSWTVKNQGNQSANTAWSDEVYISNDAVLDSSDVKILSYNVLLRPNASQPLAAGASYTVTKTVDIPGRRYDKPFVLVATDITKLQAETNENNNTRAIQVMGAPDLVVSAFSSPNLDASWGQDISLTWTVTNAGSFNANDIWYDKVYLSSDTVADSLDTQLYNDPRPAAYTILAPGASYTITKIFRISDADINKPLQPYLIVVTGLGDCAGVSSCQAETNKTNNARSLQAFALPDLAIPSASAPRFGPESVVPVTWSITNRSNRNANAAWVDRIYASTDPVLDASDLLLATDILQEAGFNPTLAPGRSYTRSRTVTTPKYVPNSSVYILRPYLLLKTGINNYSKVVDTNPGNNVIVVGTFQYLGIDPLKPFRDALATLTGAAADAMAYYANLVVAGENNISQGIATNNIALQALGYGQAVLGYAGGLASGLAVEENLLKTATVLATLIGGPAVAGTQLGKAILGNPIIATALNAVGTASDIAELNTVLNNPNLSLAEKILRSTNAVLGLATNAVDAAELARRVRIGDLGLELAILPAVGST